MGLEARKLQYPHIQEVERPHIDDQRQQRPKIRRLFTKGEKYLFAVCAVALVIFSSFILHTQAQINETNREIQVIGNDIDEVSKQNTDLSIRVSELSTYERVWQKAKELGLQMNENNVKVVPGR